MKNFWLKNIILVAMAVIICLIPLAFLKDAEFRGSDDKAETAISTVAPDYKPWASSILEPASSEIESLLFALQAAIGAGAFGFILGRITSKKDDNGASV